MAPQLVSRRDIDFNRYELFDVAALCRWERCEDLNKKILDLIISEARGFAIKEVLPTCAGGDRIGPLCFSIKKSQRQRRLGAGGEIPSGSYPCSVQA